VRLVLGQLALGFETFGNDLVRCLALQHALAAGIVGGVEAAQELFELTVGMDCNAEHFAADATIEALDHAVGLRRIGPGVAILRPQFGAGFGEGGGEA
jgi:hypothetical protein